MCKFRVSSCWTSSPFFSTNSLSIRSCGISVGTCLPVVIKREIESIIRKLHLLKCFVGQVHTAVRENSNFADKKKIHRSKCMRKGS